MPSPVDELLANPLFGGTGNAPKPLPPVVPTSPAIAALEANPIFSKVLRPEQADESLPPEQRQQSVMRTHAQAGSQWEAVQPDLARRFPGTDPAKLKDQFRLEAARVAQSKEGESDIEALARRAGPFSSALGNFARESRYADALKSFNEGKATDEEIAKIARFERLQELDRSRGSTVGGATGDALMRAPAILGEAYLGGRVLKPAGAAIGRTLGVGSAAAPGAAITLPGAAIPAAAEAVPGLARQALGYAGKQAALTPLMPSLYMEQAAQKNREEGRDPTNIKGFVPAMGLAYANNLVLGSLSKVGANASGGLLGRTAVRAGVGVGGQAAVDVSAGLADEFVPKAYKMGTRYGVLGHLARGEEGEAMKQAAVQAITFGLFGALHDAGPVPERPGTALTRRPLEPDLGGGQLPPKPVHPVIQAFSDVLDHYAKQGVSPEKAAQAVQAAMGLRIGRAVRENPNLTREDTRKLFEQMPDGPLKKYGMAIADVFPAAKPAEPAAPPTEPGRLPVSANTEPAKPNLVVTEGNPSEQSKRATVAQNSQKSADGKDLGGSAEINPTQTKAKPSEKAVGIVQKKVAKLGNLKAVDEFYDGDNPADRYAREYARTVFKEPAAAKPPPAASKVPPLPEVRPAADLPAEGVYRVHPAEAAEARAKMAALEAEGGKLPPLPVVKPKTAFERRNAVRSEAAQGSLAKVVKGFGGIDPTDAEFLKHYESKARAIEDGIPEEVFKKGGRGLDQIAQELGPHDPTTGLKGGGYVPDANPETVLRMLKEGTPHLHAEQPATHAKGLDEHYQRVQQEAEGQPASESDEGGLTTGDVSFDFDPTALEQPSSSSDGTSRPLMGGPSGRPGKLTLPSYSGSNLEAVVNNVSDGIRAVHDEWQKLSGKMFPATTRRSEPLANAMATLISTKATNEAAWRYIRKAVFGDLTKPTWAKFYTAHLESRLRYMGSATSLIGPDSPIKTPAEFRQIVTSPAFGRYLQRWKAVMVPIMEENFRKAEGLPAGTPIPAATQIPGYPVNLVRARPAAATGSTVFHGGRTRERLENVKHGKFSFGKAATGESQTGYETDPEKAIPFALQHGFAQAAKAELYRVAEAEKVGVWAKPGDPQTLLPTPPLAKGEPARSVRDVDPPKGVQRARPGQTDFRIAEGVYDEFRDALETDRKFRIPGLTPLLGIVNRASIASTVEMSFHSANQLSHAIRPRVLVKVVPQVLGSLYRGIPQSLGLKAKGSSTGPEWFTDEQLKREMEMAQIGGTKEKGFESGLLLPAAWSHLDPTAWSSSLLDFVDRHIRLGMDKAFTAMASANLAADTTANRRDFLNAGGQYKRAAQAKLVKILRDTGIGPFSVAATNFVAQSIRGLVWSPLVKGANFAAGVRLRGERLAALVAAIGGAQLLNWAFWDRWDGDDSTPLGAVKVGEREGRTYYIDVGRMVGVTRGAQATGLKATAEGWRRGSSNTAVLHQAEEDVTHAFLHPMTGPGVQFAYTAKTGRNTLGMNLAGSPDAGDVQEWENLKAAMKNANPTIATMIGADRVKPSEKMPFFAVHETPDNSDRVKLLRLTEPYLRSRKSLPFGAQIAIEERAAKKR